jgi:hypothetical protein
MKAIIAKDNQFNTIGFQVVTDAESNNVIFTWGITPNVAFNFVKEIKVDEKEIISLVVKQTKLQDLERFHMRFFDVCIKNQCLKKSKDGKGSIPVNFSDIDDEISQLKREIAIKIQTFA